MPAAARCASSVGTKPTSGVSAYERNLLPATKATGVFLRPRGWPTAALCRALTLPSAPPFCGAIIRVSDAGHEVGGGENENGGDKDADHYDDVLDAGSQRCVATPLPVARRRRVLAQHHGRPVREEVHRRHRGRLVGGVCGCWHFPARKRERTRDPRARRARGSRQLTLSMAL